jgi:hypothetical protein
MPTPSAITPIEIAHRLYQQAEDSLPDPVPFLDDARTDLIERLISGKSVNRVTSRDIFDTAVDGSYHQVLDILEAVLALNDKCGDDFFLDANECARNAEKVIEAYVDSKEDWIWERACEIACDEENDRE